MTARAEEETHFVIQIDVKQVRKRIFSASSTRAAGYVSDREAAAEAAVKDLPRSIDDVVHLVIKAGSLEEAIDQTMRHLEIHRPQLVEDPTHYEEMARMRKELSE